MSTRSPVGSLLIGTRGRRSCSTLSRLHEQEEGQAFVLAGDFNVRDGEDLCLRAEGWRDAWGDAAVAGAELQDEWTGRRGASTARRHVIHGTTSKQTCTSAAAILNM